MYPISVDGSWYQRHWLAPVRAQKPGPVARLLTRLGGLKLGAGDAEAMTPLYFPPI